MPASSFVPTKLGLVRTINRMQTIGIPQADIDAEVERQVEIRVEQYWNDGYNGKPDIRKKVLVELGFAKWCVVCRIGNGKQPSVGVVFIPEAKRTHPFAVTEQCWGCGGEKIVTPQTNQLRR